MSVKDSSIIHNCTSCQLCGAVCPKGAVTIELDKEGFYRPTVKDELCIDCGLCVKVCYKYDNQIKLSKPKDLKRKPLYSAWAKDADLLKETTSGGIGDLLAKQLINDGYKVVGVVYNEGKTRAEHRIAGTVEETKPFRGSKYIQSYTFDAFKKVVAECKNSKYAVFGTPCQIYALHKSAEIRKDQDNFIFIDLFCHGCPSLHVWTKYQKQIKKEAGVAQFDQVVFRSKVRGWGTFNVVFKKDEKTYFTNKACDDGFYELFFCDQVLNEGCNDCRLRGTLEYTDIRLGDFWGKKFLNNRAGVSAVCLATDKGDALFQKIKAYLVFQECSYEECLPYQSWDLVYKPRPELRKLLLESLVNEQKDIYDAVRILHKHQSKKNKMKRYVKNVLRHCPIGITMFLKKFL